MLFLGDAFVSVFQGSGAAPLDQLCEGATVTPHLWWQLHCPSSPPSEDCRETSRQDILLHMPNRWVFWLDDLTVTWETQAVFQVQNSQTCCLQASKFSLWLSALLISSGTGIPTA